MTVIVSKSNFRPVFILFNQSLELSEVSAKRSNVSLLQTITLLIDILGLYISNSSDT